MVVEVTYCAAQSLIRRRENDMESQNETSYDGRSTLSGKARQSSWSIFCPSRTLGREFPGRTLCCTIMSRPQTASRCVRPPLENKKAVSTRRGGRGVDEEEGEGVGEEEWKRPSRSAHRRLLREVGEVI